MMLSFGSETIFSIGYFPVTNTIINTIFVDILLLLFTFLVYKNLSKVPGKLQIFAEFVIGGLYDLTDSIAGKETGKIFPYFITFFLFILLANWSGLIPGFTTIGLLKEGNVIPIIRSATTDLNTTFALAIISVITTHMLSIKTLGIKEYLSRYISINPIYLFVGLLEIVLEFAKLISLSFRLFGNIFAGEVVLGKISSIFAFGFPLPFIGLEAIVGFVQALVFSMLTMAFMVILMTPHHEKAKEVSQQ